MKKKNWFRLTVGILTVVGLLFTTSVMAAEKGKQEIIQGLVEKGDKGITMIKTDDGRSVTILGQNMAEMIGKTVKVTGTLSKGKAATSIIVTHFEEVQN